MDQEHDLEHIIDASPDAMVLVDAAGRIVLVNSQAESMFGYTRAEMLGETVELLIPNRFRAEHTNHRESFTANPKKRGMGTDLELYGRNKDGRDFAIDVNLSPVELSGSRHVLAAVRDFSVRRKAELELRGARDAARRANAVKTRFLAAASHDLRQPLQSLGLYLSVLSKQVTEDPAGEIVSKMQTSLDAMGDMLDVLLDLSKLESGTVVPERIEFSVSSLLDDVVDTHGTLANEKGIELNVASVETTGFSDPLLLRRIIDNLVTNAIRYTDKGSVLIEASVDTDHVCISVRDSGSGIPEDKREIIFDEYYQLENPSRDRRSGLGLGLSIVKHIARLLDHPIKVESELGKGSVFSVTIPQSETQVAAADVEDNEVEVTVAQHTNDILLVDDDPSIIDAMTLLLEAEGYHVFAATDSEEALVHVSDGLVPSFIVSDYRLPGPTGVELIRLVRNKVKTTVPAVLITGDTTARLIEETDLPVCKVLHKPVDTGVLLQMLRSGTVE